jgi:hypothetical protein
VVVQVDLEGRVAALVARDEGAVEPDRRLVVDGAEVQDQPLFGRERRQLEAAPVPAGAVEPSVADAAAGDLGREGTLDGAVPRDLARQAPTCVGVEGEVSRAVQRGPIGASQLRARVAEPRGVEPVGAETSELLSLICRRWRRGMSPG